MRAQRRRRIRRIAAIAGTVVVVVAAATGAVELERRAADRRRRDLSLGAVRDRPGAPVISRSPTPLPALAGPLSYHVVYEVHDQPTGTDVVTTEEDWVRRPFEGRQELRSGPPPGKKVTATSINGFATFEQRNAGATATQVIQVPPNVPGNDLRPDLAQRGALAPGLIELREHRRVLGRECQVIRTRRVAAATDLSATADDPDVRNDLCFDAHGLLLEEATIRDGRIVHRRLARRVETDVALDDALFATTPGTPVSLSQGGGSVRPLVPTSRPPGGSFYELSGAPPDGFTLRGRYAVVPPQPEAFTDPTKRSSQVAGVVDVYVNGRDVVLIDRGGTLGGGPAFARLPTSTPVDLGPLGSGELILGLATNQVRVTLPDGHYLRIAGTLPGDQLVALARRMEPQPAGELQFLDAP